MNREPVEQTLADIADFLNLQGVPFAVVGGIAVAVRGESRFTADVDIVLGIDLEQALALLTAVQESSFQPLFADAQDVVQASFLLPLRHQESGIKVDLAIGLSGFERQMIARSTPVQLAGRSIPIVSAEDLILMKLLASRPRDISDIDGIVEYQGAGLDWIYLLQVGRKLTEAVGQDFVSAITKLRSSAGEGNTST